MEVLFSSTPIPLQASILAIRTFQKSILFFSYTQSLYITQDLDNINFQIYCLPNSIQKDEHIAINNYSNQLELAYIVKQQNKLCFIKDFSFINPCYYEIDNPLYLIFISKYQLLTFNQQQLFKISLKQKFFTEQLFTTQETIELITHHNHKIGISTTKFYYVYDLNNNTTIKVGTTEKKSLFGLIFYQELLFAGRPNGQLWKANIETGQVLSTLKFVQDNGQKIKIGRLAIIESFLLNIQENCINLINLDQKVIQKTYQNIKIKSFDQFSNLAFGIDEKNIYKFELLSLQTTFEKLDQEQKLDLFIKYKQLQTLENLTAIGPQENQDLFNIIQDIILIQSIYKLETPSQCAQKERKIEVKSACTNLIDLSSKRIKIVEGSKLGINQNNLKIKQKEELSYEDFRNRCQRRIKDLLIRSQIIEFKRIVKDHILKVCQYIGLNINKKLTLGQILQSLKMDDIKIILEQDYGQEYLNQQDIRNIFQYWIEQKEKQSLMVRNIQLSIQHIKNMIKDRIINEKRKIQQIDRAYIKHLVGYDLMVQLNHIKILIYC